MSRTVPLFLSGLLMLTTAAPGAAQVYDAASTPPGPWYVDPVEMGPLYGYRDDRALPLWAYPGDEDATDFANRYGCKPIWDGAVNRYVAACNTH
jgi:hypothetical protein